MNREREDSTGGVSASSLRLLNQVAAFHYVTAPNAPTYRALVHAYLAKDLTAAEIDALFQ